MFVQEGIYKIEATKGAYAYVIQNEHGITMIDTFFPDKGEEILSELKQAGLDRIDRILLTHTDFDHIGNMEYIQAQTNCDIYIPAREQEAIDDPTKNKSRGERRPFEGVTLPPMEILPEDGIAGITVIPAYGHSWGHTCYLFEGVLFAGDLVAEEDGKWVELDLKYIRDHEASLEAIKTVSDNYEFHLVCPTHGEPIACTEIIVEGGGWLWNG